MFVSCFIEIYIYIFVYVCFCCFIFIEISISFLLLYFISFLFLIKQNSNIKSNSKKQIIQVIEGLAKDFQQTEDEVDALIKKYGLSQQGEKQTQKKEEAKKSGGVLVG